MSEDTVGIGIVGLGRWANAHANAIARADGVALVDCHARTESTREEFAARHSVPHTSPSLEAMLANDAVEAVIVSTPNDLHVAHVESAIAAGKPALVDKPVCVDVGEGLELMRMADAAGVPVGVAHHSRRLGGVRAAKRWISSGESGPVRIAHADFSNARGAHLKPDAWHRTVKGSDAGVLIQVGIHPVENLLHLLGPATAVNARFSYHTLGPDMPDAAAVTMIHASGATSMVSSSWTTPGHFTFDLLGVEGNLGYRLDHGHWPDADIDDYGELFLDFPGRPAEPYPVSKRDPLRMQVEELASSTRGGTMAVDVAAGLRAMLVVLGSVRSARNDGAPADLAEMLTAADATPQEIDRLLGPDEEETA